MWECELVTAYCRHMLADLLNEPSVNFILKTDTFDCIFKRKLEKINILSPKGIKFNFIIGQSYGFLRMKPKKRCALEENIFSNLH